MPSYRQRRIMQPAVRRHTFCEHVFGMQTDKPVTALKAHLASAGLLDSPTRHLDAVMLDDVEHLYDLIGRDGIPLARDTLPTDFRPRMVDVVSHWRWRTRVIAVVALTGDVLFLLDALLDATTSFSILPV